MEGRSLVLLYVYPVLLLRVLGTYCYNNTLVLLLYTLQLFVLRPRSAGENCLSLQREAHHGRPGMSQHLW